MNAKFDSFMTSEYNNIAQAHHNTVNTITAFFKHYITFIAVPIPLVLFIANRTSVTISNYINQYPCLPWVSGLTISVVGLLVMCYMVNLRHDALLYARTVNGIRNYYYKNSNLHVSEVLKTKVLPKSISTPRYFEFFYFIPVVLAFAIIDSVYCFVGYLVTTNFYIRLFSFVFKVSNINMALIISMFVFFLHFISYWFLSKRREKFYLRSRIIGIDIDGVLNKHRHHFCVIHKEHTGQNIDPDDIKKIPVRNNTHLNIHPEKECAVFHDTSYWTKMPKMEGVSDCLNKLKNGMDIKIYIYTHRPWPMLKTINAADWNRLKEKWHSIKLSWVDRIFGCNRMDKMTKQWLDYQKIPYKKLVIEKTNKHKYVSKYFEKNRYTHAQKYNIRYFVEDTLENALKLAETCDVVFLIDHPYNQTSTLPYNVIRVHSWGEIVDFIRYYD